MDLTTILVAVYVALVAKWFWERYSVHQTWRRLGIKGPNSSSILFGNITDIMAKGTWPLYAEWTKAYGKVFGYYEAGMPVLVTSDPDMVREIFIKQFDKFTDRLLLIDNRTDPLNNLVDQPHHKWQKVRGLSSPTFSAKRMKQMSPLVHKCVDKLIERLNERAEQGDAFDIAADVKRLTLDVIASTVFSYETDVFNEDDNIFLLKLIELFKNLDLQQADIRQKIRVVIGALFPGFTEFLRKFHPRAITPPNQWFMDLGKRMIQDRLDTKEFRNDYIQLMLMHGKKHQSGNASGTDTEDDVSDNELRQTAHDLRHRAKKKERTMEEMQGQIFVFLAAGYETTATTLAYMSYYLALYPDVQSKLQEEIDEYFPDLRIKPVNYETVQTLPYLDMVFAETSRLGSIAQVVTTRVCMLDTEVCGYSIPKGSRVAVNQYEIHRDPELWGPEPVEEFVPERFTKERKGERHPMAYIPFGSGPRNCIGMRFAIMEAKMAMINILRRFTIIRCSETQVPLKITKDGIRGPAEGVFVRLVKRK